MGPFYTRGCAAAANVWRRYGHPVTKIRLSAMLLAVAAVGGVLNALAGLVAAEYLAVAAYSVMAGACAFAALRLWTADAARPGSEG